MKEQETTKKELENVKDKSVDSKMNKEIQKRIDGLNKDVQK